MYSDQIKESLNVFSWHSNRALNQTLFLFELCDNDFQKLLLVEEKIKNHHLSYCPGDKEELNKILLLEKEKDKEFFDLEHWRFTFEKDNKWCMFFEGKNGRKHYLAIPTQDVGKRIDLIDFREGKEWSYMYSVTEQQAKEIYPAIKIVIENGEITVPKVIVNKT
jgi:hypothetical protein